MNTSSLINYKSSEREADTQTVPLAGVVLFGISTISALPSSTSFFPAEKKKETADKTDIVMLGGGGGITSFIFSVLLSGPTCNQWNKHHQHAMLCVIMPVECV